MSYANYKRKSQKCNYEHLQHNCKWIKCKVNHWYPGDALTFTPYPQIKLILKKEEEEENKKKKTNKKQITNRKQQKTIWNPGASQLSLTLPYFYWCHGLCWSAKCGLCCHKRGTVWVRVEYWLCFKVEVAITPGLWVQTMHYTVPTSFCSVNTVCMSECEHAFVCVCVCVFMWMAVSVWMCWCILLTIVIHYCTHCPISQWVRCIIHVLYY